MISEDRPLDLSRGWIAFTDWFNGLALSENAVLLSFAVAIGLLSALGVAVFYGAIDLAFAAFYRAPAVVRRRGDTSALVDRSTQQLLGMVSRSHVLALYE